MKKICIFMSFLFIFAFISCGNQSDSKTPKKTVENTDTELSEDDNPSVNSNDNITNTNDDSAANINSDYDSTSEKHICRKYFYNIVDDKIYYSDLNLEFSDVEVLKDKLLDSLKDSLNTDIIVVPENVYVESMDYENDVLTLNLSKSYYDILSNIGSSSELGLLNSIALTYGYNYGCSEIIILVDGTPYNSGHISFDTYEAIDIKTLTSEEFKE